MFDDITHEPAQMLQLQKNLTGYGCRPLSSRRYRQHRYENERKVYETGQFIKGNISEPVGYERVKKQALFWRQHYSTLF
jgi:hypothetical protein